MLCISAKCCYSPRGPKSDSLCWCSNSKLGHFHALEFLPKWWKVQSIPRGCWLFNTRELGTSYNLKISDPSSTGVMERGMARSASAQKSPIWLNSVPGNHVTRHRQLFGERGYREGGALLCFPTVLLYQPLAGLAAPWGRYEWHLIEKKRYWIEQTCNRCMFPVMLTCCFYDICVKQSLPSPRSLEKR